MSDSVRPHRRQPTRLPFPWDSPGKNTGVGCHFLLQSMRVQSEREVAESCPTLSDPMNCSLPASSVHGIFQARVLEWGAIAFSVLPMHRGLFKMYLYISKHLKIFIYFWLHRVFIAALRLSLAVVSRWLLYSCHVWASHCSGWLQSRGCGAHGLQQLWPEGSRVQAR